MLRALKQSLDTGVPVFGINFGRVGFLTAVDADDFESGLTRALAGDFVVVELPTLEADVGRKDAHGGERLRRDELDARADGHGRAGRWAARTSARSRATG